jgi:hypothetical protein
VVEPAGDLLGSRSLVRPGEGSISIFNVYEFVKIQEFLKFFAVLFQSFLPAPFFLQSEDHVEVSTQYPSLVFGYGAEVS